MLALLLIPVASASARHFDDPVDDYASYQPQKHCRKTPRPGTKQLAAWIDKTFDGGTAYPSMRACSKWSTSEHQDGRALDWMMSATSKADRAEVQRFFDKIFATDADGNEHALARRMGIMYVIWNDHIYSSYYHFGGRKYLNGGCKKIKTCSPTLRHRDHVHISLSLAGGRADTSWYEH